MRVVVFATDCFSTAIIRWLMDNGYLVGLVTKADKPRGRGRKLRPKLAAEMVQSAGFPVFKADKLTKECGVKEFLEELKPDLAIVVDYGVYIPRFIWESMGFPFVNIHPSLLPRFRGGEPVRWTILVGDKIAGVTYHMLGSSCKKKGKWDSGDIVLQRKISLDGNESVCELLCKLQKLAVGMLPEFLERFSKGELKLVPQPETDVEVKASYRPFRSPLKLHFNLPAKVLERIIRAWAGAKRDEVFVCEELEKFSFEGKGSENYLRKLYKICNNPGAYITIEVSKGKEQRIRVKILKATVVAGKAEPGKVVWLSRSEFGIGTKEGILIPLVLQPDNKGVLLARDFMNGYRPKDGGLCL